MTQDQNSLARLTLRQLRHKASEYGVPLYSRKSKASLVKEITLAQNKQESKSWTSTAFWRAPEDKSQEHSNATPVAETRVVFLPRDPQWSYVFWEISEADREKAFSKGANKLCLRLTDVTGLQDGTAHRQTLQEVPVDSHATEWYLSIPMSDRDYRVELGYQFRNSWISLAFSGSARVPALYPSDQILDQFVPFSLESTETTSTPPVIQNLTSDQGDSGLHEKLYQTATTHFLKSRVGSELLHDERSPQALNDSGIGLWASGRNESGIGGVSPRQKSFWLVADSELVIYGSTDPSAQLTIGGQEVPLSKDGTFRLQVPFRDGIQKYPIEAKDITGSQRRNITIQCERVTPEDNTNPQDQAQIDWF